MENSLKLIFKEVNKSDYPASVFFLFFLSKLVFQKYSRN